MATVFKRSYHTAMEFRGYPALSSSSGKNPNIGLRLSWVILNENHHEQGKPRAGRVSDHTFLRTTGEDRWRDRCRSAYCAGCWMWLWVHRRGVAEGGEVGHGVEGRTGDANYISRVATFIELSRWDNLRLKYKIRIDKKRSTSLKQMGFGHALALDIPPTSLGASLHFFYLTYYIIY